MSLTVAKIDAAKPKPNDYKLFDGDGLFLLVTKKGHKWWRFKYRFAGREKLLSLGTYPEVSLPDARIARGDARKLVATGTDPSSVRKSLKASLAAAAAPAPGAVTLRDAATAWVSYHRQGTPGSGRDWSDSYTAQVEKRLERHVLRRIGETPVQDVTSAKVLNILGPLGSDIQHRVKRDLHRVFDFAGVHGWRPQTAPNPAGVLGDLLRARPPVKNFAAITDPTEFGGLLRACESYFGSFTVRTLLRLAPLLFQRPTELRLARWNEFDIEGALWSIPPERMKSEGEGAHPVPLSRQAIAILYELMPVTGKAPDSLLFPAERQRGKDVRPLSDATITAALANMGYRGRQTTHGFRASARTMMVERLKVDERYVERQLDHLTKAPDGTAYDRTKFLDERRLMMQQWADYLDGLKGTASWEDEAPEPVAPIEEDLGFTVRKIFRPPVGGGDGRV
jgi:integrase